MTKKVGITGGIGSGKTTVCRIFETLNVPVLYADPLARKLMRERLDLRASLIDCLGASVFNTDGELNKEYIAKQIFNDKNLLIKVNGVVHPAVFQYTKRWFERQRTSYALKEAALIFEGGGETHLDKIIHVSARQDIRVSRVIQRDGLSQQEVEQRMNNQWSDQKKESLSDFIIVNNGEESLIEQILKIHHNLQDTSK